MKRHFRLSAVILSLFLLTACTQTRSPAPSVSASPSSTPTPSPTPSVSSEEAMQEGKEALQTLIDMTSYSPVDYTDLARDPDSYYMKGVELSGTVFQTISDKNSCVLLMAVDGNYNQILWVGYDYDEVPVTVIEDDTITIQAVCMGTSTYTTAMGVEKTVPSVLVKGELTVVQPPAPADLEYNHGPFELEEYGSYSGRLQRYTQIESFEITSIEESYSGGLKINYTVIGTVYQSSHLSFDIKCYDADGFLVDSTGVYASVSDGERFRVNDYSYIPADTVRLEFSAD